MIIFYHVACIYITYYLNLYSGLDAFSVLLRFPSWFLFYEYFIYLNAVISMAAELRNRRLPLKSLKIPEIFSHSLRNRLKLSQLPTHLCTHFCAALRPTSLQNPSPFLPSVSDPHCIRPTPLPFTQSFLSYPLSYLTASYGMASA